MSILQELRDAQSDWLDLEDGENAKLACDAILEIESLTASNNRLQKALRHAIEECEFSYLRNQWEQVLEENGR